MTNNDFPIENADTFHLEPLVDEEMDEHAAGWYEKWRTRVHEWTAEHGGELAADILILVPDIFAMLVGLAKDSRIDAKTKLQLAGVIAYFVMPVDLMPEAVMGALGLADDVTIAALFLTSLQTMSKIDPAVLRDHWRGEQDPAEVLQNVVDFTEKNADRLFNDDIWKAIRGWVKRENEETASDTSKRRWSLPRFSRLWGGKSEPDETPIEP